MYLVVRTYKRKTEEVDGDQMRQAWKAVKYEGYSQREASRCFAVPRCTLQSYLKKNYEDIPDDIRSGRFTTLFTKEQEDELVKNIIDLSKRFYGMTRKTFMRKAYLVAERNGIPHPFKNGHAGYEWMRGFLKRHHEALSVRTAQPTCLARIFGFKKSTVDHFFNNLESIVNEKHYLPHQIYNADETGMTVVLTRAPKILAQRGAKHVATIKATERGRLVTVMACASAGGAFIPPFFIFPGNKRQDQDQKVSMGPSGSSSTNSPKGWMIASTFLEWMEHFRAFAQPSEDNPVLLILDNHTSHISIEAVEFARESYIDLLTLPPHTSHKLQPLDVGFFGPLKARLNDALHEWQNWHRFQRPQELDLPAIFCRPFEDTARSDVAKSAFRKTGIWVPFANGPDRNVFYPDEFCPEDSADQVANEDSNRDDDDMDDGSPPAGEQDLLEPPAAFTDKPNDEQLDLGENDPTEAHSFMQEDASQQLESNFAFDFDNDTGSANYLSSVQEIGQIWENQVVYFDDRSPQPQHERDEMNHINLHAPHDFLDDPPPSPRSRHSSSQSIDSLTLASLPVYPWEGNFDENFVESLIPPPLEFMDKTPPLPVSCSSSGQSSQFTFPPHELDPPDERPKVKPSNRQMKSTLLTSDGEYELKKKKKDEKEAKLSKKKTKTPTKLSPQVALQRRAAAIRKQLARESKSRRKPQRQQPGRSVK